jgi:hypothetical protein
MFVSRGSLTALEHRSASRVCQFTSLLVPLDSSALLQRNMTVALEALQANRDVLLNTMAVFVQVQ